MEPTRADAPVNTTAVQPNGDGLAQKAGQLGETAKQGAAEAAASVKQEVVAATSDAAAQARSLLDQSRSQLKSEAAAQTEKLSGSLRQVGGQLHALAEGRPQEAGPVGDYARQAAEGLARYADGLQTKGLEGVLRDTQDFARRRPGTFLLGAAVAGVVAGRFLRNAKGVDTAATSSTPSLQAPRLSDQPLPSPSPGSMQASDHSGDWGSVVGVGGAAL
jgi:hypothetical protein